MQLACASCGGKFEAKRANAKYCGERCRKRAQRKPPATVVGLPSRPRRPGRLAKATKARLEKVGRLDSELGEAVLLLADRLDRVGMVDTGGGIAALMREFRATLAEAVKDDGNSGDALEEIREAAALKLIAGGRA
jgi:hypothetical protein